MRSRNREVDVEEVAKTIYGKRWMRDVKESEHDDKLIEQDEQSERLKSCSAKVKAMKATEGPDKELPCWLFYP